MKHIFIPSPDFIKSLKVLAKRYTSIKDDLKRFEEEMDANPQMGTPLGGGYRKIRLEIKSKHKGKSGGARIISYDLDIVVADGEESKQLLLVNIYDKSDRSTLKDFQYKPIVEEYLQNQNLDNKQKNGNR